MPSSTSGIRKCALFPRKRKSSATIQRRAATDAMSLDRGDRSPWSMSCQALRILGPSRWRWMRSPTEQRVALAAFRVLEVEAGRERLGRACQDHDRRFEIVLEIARHVAQLAHCLVGRMHGCCHRDRSARRRMRPWGPSPFSIFTKRRSILAFLPVRATVAPRLCSARAGWIDLRLMSKSITSLALERRIDALFARYTKPGSPGAVVAVMRDGQIEVCKEKGLRAGQHRAWRADHTQDTIPDRLGQQAVHRHRRPDAGRREQARPHGLAAQVLAGLKPLPVTIDQMMRNSSGLPDFLELLRLGGHGLDKPARARRVPRRRGA